MKLAKLKLIAIAVIIVSILIIIGIIVFNALKTARMTIIALPLDAEIYVNGSRRDSGTYDTFPGKNTIRVQKDGFDTKEIEVNLESHKTSTVYIYLAQNGELSYYESNQTEYDLLKMIADENAKEFIEKTEKKLSITEILPLEKFEEDESEAYSIDNVKQTTIDIATEEDGCDKIICLTLLDNTDSHDAAKRLLEENGYNLDDYKVIDLEY